jgi:hypothetical protein
MPSVQRLPQGPERNRNLKKANGETKSYNQKKFKPGSLAIKRFFVAFGIDALFVLVSLIMAFIGVTVVAYLRAGKGLSWLDLKPVMWVTQISLWRLLAGAFLVYLVYLASFYVIVGSTIGYMSLKGEKHRPS